MSSKCYFAYNDEENDIKKGNKGVPFAEAQKLTLEQFQNCLNDDVIPSVIARGLLKNKKQQIEYYENSKKGLNPIFKKFRVQSDKISCLPLTQNGKVL